LVIFFLNRTIIICVVKSVVGAGSVLDIVSRLGFTVYILEF